MSSTRRSPLREQLVGVALALYLTVGRWSPSRISDLEPSPLLEPRIWAVALLVLVALNRPPQLATRATRSPGHTLIWFSLSGFLAYMLTSLAWSFDAESGRAATLDMSLMFVANLCVYRLASTLDPRALLLALERALLVILGALASIALLTSLAQGGRLATLGGGPNIFGRQMSMLAILCVYRAFTRGPRAWLWSVAAVLATTLVIFTGSRGALLALACSLIFVAAIGVQGIGRRLRAAVVGLFFAAALLLYSDFGSRAIETFQVRVIDLAIGQRYVSGRDTIVTAALELVEQRPFFGHGLGSFSSLTPWPYAHNSFLDALVEGGAVACLLYVLALLTGMFSYLYARLELMGYLGACAVLIFVSSQFSGGFYDGRALYVFMLLTPVLGYRLQHERPASGPSSSRL